MITFTVKGFDTLICKIDVEADLNIEYDTLEELHSSLKGVQFIQENDFLLLPSSDSK